VPLLAPSPAAELNREVVKLPISTERSGKGAVMCSSPPMGRISRAMC